MQGNQFLPQPPGFSAMREAEKVALFLDFDGTLVDIAPTPDAIRVPQGLADALHRLSDLLEGRLALVSGRAIADIEGFLGPLAIARAGSHGIDRRLAGGAVLDAVAEGFPEDARALLADFAQGHGFSLEAKPHGAALHYRSNPAIEDQGLNFAEEVAAAHGLVVKRGKCVIELVRPGADKGGAVRAFMQHAIFAGSHPVFIGDDVTDEDGFAAVGEYGGTAIVVGDRRPTRASYRIEGPAGVLDWLGLT